MTNTLACDTVSFTGREKLSPVERYERAMDIIDCFTKDQIQNMDAFDQSHLEGIQYGLKSFEGMSFKDIYFLLSRTENLTIPLYRDCSGRCAACFLNGRPKEHNLENKNLIERTDFEDFKTLAEDLKEIVKRTKFDCRLKGLENMAKKYSAFGEPLTALFYDSDSKDTWLKDKNGNIHEFPELNKMLYDAVGVKGLFDTAGWSPTNKKVQERIERTVEYYTNNKNQNELECFNISLNTYNGLMKKANDFKEKGDLDGYNRMRAQYVKNIANAMYTFTPLLNCGMYQVMAKCVSEDEGKEFDNYKTPVLKSLEEDIINALRQRYEQDLEQGNTKFVKDEIDIDMLIDEQKNSITRPLTNLSPNPVNELFSKLPEDDDYYFIKDNEYADFYKVLDNADSVIIDMNGKIYLANDNETFETELQLNFKNKDKETKQIYPIPDERKLNIKNKTFD